MRALWIMTLSDMRLRLRDRSVLLFALVIPTALMYVLSLTYTTEDLTELSPVTVAVSVPDGDPYAPVVLSCLTDQDAVKVTVERTGPERAQSLASSGRVALGVVVPEGFGAAVSNGTGPQVRAFLAGGTGAEGEVLTAVLSRALDQLHDGAVVARAAVSVGVPGDEVPDLVNRAVRSGPAISPLKGTVAAEQLSVSGALVAGQAGLFLFFTVGFGVLALVSERQTGTWDRLCSMPLRPSTVVASKALGGFLLGTVATTVLLVVGSFMFDTGFGSPGPVAVLVLCAVAAVTACMFAVARVVRTAEQANLAQSALAMVLGLAGGAFFPVNGPGPIDRILDLNPVAAFSRGLGITSGGGGLTDLGTPIVILLGFAVTVLGISQLLPDRGRIS